MDTPDSILISDITKKYTFSTEEALELYDRNQQYSCNCSISCQSRQSPAVLSVLQSDHRQQKRTLKNNENCFSNPGSVNPSNAIKPKISRQIPILMKKKKN